MLLDFAKYSLRSFVRVWCIAFGSALLGFILVLAARQNVDGMLATTGALLAAVSVFAGFVAFALYVIAAITTAVQRRQSQDNRK